MTPELVGLIAVGTVIVEGAPGTAQAFTEAERSAVHLSVIRAEQALSRFSQRFSPNRFLQCSFFNELRSVVINPGAISRPTNTTQNLALRNQEIVSIEKQWRNVALRALGFPSPEGSGDPLLRYQDELLLKDWRVPQKPRNAVVIFVTKFNMGWLAYMPDQGQVSLQFDWLCDTSDDFRGTGAGGVGIQNLDRVITHELGHVFGGLDEYGPCLTITTSGPRPTMNLNCGGPDPCLMRNNAATLCLATVDHFGWVDLDGDGVVDAARPLVDEMTPATGTGGDVVSIRGTGLGEARSVVFVGVGAADFTILADTHLDVIVPQGSSGEVGVFVRTPFGVTMPSAILRFAYS
jgi:IPT/TIG domain